MVRRGKVISYPIATPRPDEVWSGSTKVSKKKFNPDWYPTPAMREKNPNLPEKVAGGSKYNPFGKRAIYLGKSLYRIHGTNRPGSIGRSASGGCYRMHNNDIRKLWRKVKVGTPVVVLTKRKI
ncbi:MAG: L,D-transpeptidase [Hyphomicrobiaceae bacterium]|nr:L,D-transpeptidase [Hyphomicrobiaceae bacterium]